MPTNGDRYKAIESSKDIPTNMMMMRKYLRHEEEKDGRPYKRGFRYGRNAKWRLNINFKKVSGEEFLHYWNESKKVYDTSNFIVLKPAAMQAENSYGLGSFVNSSEKQFTKELNKGLTKELGWAVELNFRDAPATYSTIDGFWKEAKHKGGRDMKAVYALAPQAMTVHCKASSVSVRNNLVKELQRRYGGHDELGRYNQLPDGSRMRFVPAENRTPMIQRHMLKTLLATHIKLKSNAQTIDFPYECDMSTTFKDEPTTNGKTLGKLILELESKDPKFNNEPIFRHFCHSWNKEFKDYGKTVSVHPAMVPMAVEALRTLPTIMKDIHGEAVARALKPAVSRWRSQIDELEPAESEAGGGWVIDEYDRYGAQGGGNFVITGMTEIQAGEGSTRQSATDNVSLLTPGTDMTDRTFGENFNRASAPIVHQEATDTSMGNTNEGTEGTESETRPESQQLELHHFTSLMQQYGPTPSGDAERLLAEYREHQKHNDTSHLQHLQLHQQVHVFMNKRAERERVEICRLQC